MTEGQAKRERILKDKTKRYIEALIDKIGDIQLYGYIYYSLPRVIVDEVSKAMNKECPVEFFCVQEKLGDDNNVDVMDAYLITTKGISPSRKNELAEKFRAIIKKEYSNK